VGPEKKKNRKVCKKKKPWIDMECEEKYRTIKSLSRTLQENPWDKHLRIKVYKLIKKDFNKLTRKKHRLYRNILINKIVESEKNDPNEFWKTIDKLKNRSSDPSSGISSHEWFTYLYPELWRENYIKPVFKGGCLNNPSNYRGLALSSCFGKFFSKILHNKA
jgi:hypothetical protein